MTITYYLGAGASFNTIPIVHEFPKELNSMARSFNTASNSSDIPKDQKDFLYQISTDLEYLAIKSKTYDSLDTFAQRIYDLGPDPENELMDLERIKFLLSIFICCHQQTKNLHNRYRYFLTKITRSILEKFQPTVHVNLISWNYDIQLELMIQSLFLPTKNIIPIIKSTNSFNEFPNPVKINSLSEKLKIYHVNGRAGMIQGEDGYVDSLLSKTFEMDPIRFALTIGRLYYYDWKNFTKKFSSLKFNWERNIDTRVINSIINSDKIVIIGYSFPDDNKSFDNMWISKLTEKTKEIIYQDPSPDQYFISTMKQKTTRIIEISGTDRFHICEELM